RQTDQKRKNDDDTKYEQPCRRIRRSRLRHRPIVPQEPKEMQTRADRAEGPSHPPARQLTRRYIGRLRMLAEGSCGLSRAGAPWGRLGWTGPPIPRLRREVSRPSFVGWAKLTRAPDPSPLPPLLFIDGYCFGRDYSTRQIK